MNFHPPARGRRVRSDARRAIVRSVLAAAALLGLGAAPVFANEPAFPQRPVTLVVPFAAGGSLDVTARILAERMKDTLGQQVLVANRPGAGSSIGARAVATAAPDGYTLLFASGSAYGFLHLLLRGFNHQLADFAPIAGVANNTSVIAANSALPVKSLTELVTLARDKPGTLNFCSTGMGGLNHLQLEMFKRQARAGGAAIELTHVPYNGVAPALTALRTREVQACMLPYSALLKNLDGKEIRVLAVQRGKRLGSMPQVATTGEQGFPGMDGNDALVNLSAPKGTPPAVLQTLENAVRTAMQDPAVIRRLEEIDVQPTFVGAAETQKWLEDDVRKFSTLIRETGITAQP